MSAVSRVIVMTSALVRSELLTAAPSDRAALNQGKPWDQKVRICMRQIVRKLREATRTGVHLSLCFRVHARCDSLVQ